MMLVIPDESSMNIRAKVKESGQAREKMPTMKGPYEGGNQENRRADRKAYLLKKSVHLTTLGA